MSSRHSYVPSKLLIRKVNKRHWITEYIHVFSPMGQPSAVQIQSN